MEDTIKITKTLDIDFFDLMTPIDADHEFTLRDVLRAAVSSTHIPSVLMSQILQCYALDEFWQEMESQEFKDDGKIEYLELYWQGSIDTYKGERMDTPGWGFHGMGRAGEIPDDLRENCTEEEIKKMEDENWRQAYAIEMSPLHKLADYSVKIKGSIWIENNEADFRDPGVTVNLRPSITLVEVLYGIMWELSFFGTPEKRDTQVESLHQTMDEFNKAKEEGRLDEVMIPWEDVKKKLTDRFGLKKEN